MAWRLDSCFRALSPESTYGLLDLVRTVLALGLLHNQICLLAPSGQWAPKLLLVMIELLQLTLM